MYNEFYILTNTNILNTIKKYLEDYFNFLNKTQGGDTVNNTNYLYYSNKFILEHENYYKTNKTYFDTFYAYLDDSIVMRNVYDYFKNMKDVPQMLPPPPGSEFQDNLKSLTENHYIRWLKDFVMTSFDEKQLLCTEGSDFYIEGDDEFC